jgi:hypothetical protein
VTSAHPAFANQGVELVRAEETAGDQAICGAFYGKRWIARSTVVNGRSES